MGLSDHDHCLGIYRPEHVSAAGETPTQDGALGKHGAKEATSLAPARDTGKHYALVLCRPRHASRHGPKSIASTDRTPAARTKASRYAGQYCATILQTVLTPGRQGDATSSRRACRAESGKWVIRTWEAPIEQGGRPDCRITRPPE